MIFLVLACSPFIDGTFCPSKTLTCQFSQTWQCKGHLILPQRVQQTEVERNRLLEFTYLGENRAERTRLAELSAWHQPKMQEREASRQGFYVPREKCGIDSKGAKEVCSTVLPTLDWTRCSWDFPGQDWGHRDR